MSLVGWFSVMRVYGGETAGQIMLRLVQGLASADATLCSTVVGKNHARMLKL